MLSPINRTGSSRCVAARRPRLGTARFSGTPAVSRTALLLALGCIAPTLACAQAGPPQAARYGLEHRSVFEHYVPHAPAPIQPWRDSNQRVHEIGGWRAYLRSVQPDAAHADPATIAGPDRPAEARDGAEGATKPATGQPGHAPSDHQHPRTGGKP